MNRNILLVALVLFSLTEVTYGQTSTTGSLIVSSAVPFLTIAPDSRGGAMGDAGVATSPDFNSQYWNPAKYVFNESRSGIALSYTPWLRNLVKDMNLAYLVGYHQLDDKQSISGSLRYFDLGSMQLFDEGGSSSGSSSPNEFAVDFGYSRKLSDYWSGAVSLRFILSDIYNGIPTIESKAGTSYAADVAFFYNKKFYTNRKYSTIAYGINISNIGSKISYTSGATKDFIPTNLRIGGTYSTEIDKYNKIGFSIDLNKLLVPSPEIDTTIDGTPILSNLGNQNVGPIEGIFISFADAPGGFSEELSEITVSLGAEYWYSNQFAVRTGYFHEATSKGDRKFVTFGAGLKMNVFSLDFSYIVTLRKTSPLENTLRFTLGFDLDDFSKQGKKKTRR
jgi:hypothetical protein